MKSKRALFILLDPYIGLSDKRTLAQVTRELRDLQSFGYFTVGISIKRFTHPVSRSGLNLAHLILNPDKWSFPEYAWALARRHYLNLHLSSLCSSDTSHIEWVRAAGLRRLEDPRYLLTI